MGVATLMGTDMSAWAHGTRHYQIDDGTHLAVESCLMYEAPVVGEQAVKQLGRPTVIFACTETGESLDGDDALTPLHSFEPGTSHEDALTMAGHTV
jgi:hypothetical protein